MTCARWRPGILRATAMVASSAVALAGCQNYEARLTSVHQAIAPDAVDGQPHFVLPDGAAPPEGATISLPQPKRSERVVRDEPAVRYPSGFAKLRFAVDATGNVSDIRVVESSNPSIEHAAMTLLRDWPFAPATVNEAPVAFRDMEVIMAFGDTVTPEEAAGTVLGVIIIVPLALAFLVLRALSGSDFKLTKWK